MSRSKDGEPDQGLDRAARALQEEHSRLASLGLLATGMAHEISNPLAGVIGCVNTLREGAVAGNRRDEYFDAIQDGLERIRATVQSLLDLAHLPSATAGFEDVDVADMVSSCIPLLQPQLRKKQLVIELRVRAGELAVRGSRSKLMQAVMNVLLNAIHASHSRGTIAVNAKRRGEMVDLRFVDQGCGIPAKLLPRVADPFFTTRRNGQGTGLGLSVTLGILQAHGGTLHIASREGEGTTVRFRLPVSGG